ncbi:ATP-binding protein [Reichenbachiella versicolor]|uniref:ATP-binding protein n=1 Tax=Reichenbachiella versicolor TaxID=1821036 RepID=UPI000D6E3CF2|nr:ATP-binding protein [Reichenbachiella versicolor]
MIKKSIRLLLIFGLFVQPALAATTAASSEAGGINIFMILFAIALFAGIGVSVMFFNKTQKAEEERDKAISRENLVKNKYEQQVINLKEKVKLKHNQGREVVKKLQASNDQNKQLRVKFQAAYDELAQKFKEAQESLKNVSQETGFQEELDKVYHKLEDAQAMILHAEKMSSLGQLTAGIAHEINNPVNFVSNGINTLKENFEQVGVFIDNYRSVCEQESLEDVKKYYKILRSDDKEYDGIIQSIQESLEDVDYGTNRITEIVNGLRIFSRQDELDVKESHVHDIVDNALLILKPKYKKKAKVLKEFDHNMPTIKCLPGQLNQALVNLIGNASDAIDFKGTITIRTINKDDDNIEIQIKDDGKGMSEEVQRKIFDPFYTTKPVGKGTGLGLSITYGIIEKHGGTVKVESVEGEGTTFFVSLPKKIKLKKIRN